jgi:hypothetical protein
VKKIVEIKLTCEDYNRAKVASRTLSEYLVKSILEWVLIGMDLVRSFEGMHHEFFPLALKEEVYRRLNHGMWVFEKYHLEFDHLSHQPTLELQ